MSLVREANDIKGYTSGDSRNSISESTPSSPIPLSSEIVTDPDSVDDGGYSARLVSGKMTASRAKNVDDQVYSHFRSMIHNPDQQDLYNRTYRFGTFIKDTISVGREFLFFTKPELYIIQRADDMSTGNLANTLVPGLRGNGFWSDLAASRPKTIALLQRSLDQRGDMFNHLLQNTVNNTLDVPAMSADYVDTASNSYGVNLSYRSSSEASDDSPEFSLEFRDSKWLDTFYYFKAFDLYETAKHHGVVGPYIDYIRERILHDQIAIFKFIVDDDMETIIYWGKMYGVTPKNVPREVFSQPLWDSGIVYSIDFKGSFYEDMRPEILLDFNTLSKPFYDAQPYHIDIYNDVLQGVDYRAATAAYVEKVESTLSPTKFVYKLKWKGSDQL